MTTSGVMVRQNPTRSKNAEQPYPIHPLFSALSITPRLNCFFGRFDFENIVGGAFALSGGADPNEASTFAVFN